MRLRRRSLPFVAIGALLVAAAVASGTGPSHDRAAAATAPVQVLELLPLQTADRRFVDAAGRDVLLRGANVNSLGEYWPGVPEVAPTIALTDADWDLMASRGFSVVRLLITWSRVEPSRGVIDQGYLDEVDAAVREAAARGIYTVIDMHQDAYSAFISTTDPGSCPAGTGPAKGWDGAPAWATLTGGLSTCVPTGADRNASPAVQQAWNNFYDDVDGIRTRFAAAWGAVSARFAGRPEVAGFDLLNEPENPRPAAQMQPIYDDFVADVIAAIRGAEAGAPFEHIVFVEPALPAADINRGLIIPSPAAFPDGTDNIAGSVHNYMESIGHEVPLEVMNAIIESITASMGVPNWGGEYGWWDTKPETLAVARRYAADEDLRRWGGAWWQWRQSCGDPHSVQWSGGQVVQPTGTETHLNLLGCPGNVDLGPNDAFLDILGRGFARATPGRLVELRSDSETGWLKVEATATEAGGRLVVWTPTADDPDHVIRALGLRDVTATAVDGGRIVTGTVEAPGTYWLWIGEPDEEVPVTTTSTTTTTAAPTSTTTTTELPSTTTTSSPSTSPTTAVPVAPAPVAPAPVAVAVVVDPRFAG